MAKCKQCGSERGPGSRYCANCGGGLPEECAGQEGIEVRCSNCGQVGPSGGFCGNCGAGLEEEAGGTAPEASEAEAPDLAAGQEGPGEGIAGEVEPIGHQEEGLLRDIVVEVGTGGHYCVRHACNLSFRVTNMTGHQWRVSVRAEVDPVFAEQQKGQKERTHVLMPRARQRIFRIPFRPRDPGQISVKHLTATLVNLDEKETSDRSRCFQLQDDSITVDVETEAGAQGSTTVQITADSLISFSELYGGDVNISNPLQILKDVHLDREGKGAQERWKPLRLFYVPTPGRSEPAFAVVEKPGRKEAGPLTLVLQDRDSERRIFVFPKRELSLGRSAVESDVVLRFMPCDSSSCSVSAYRKTRDRTKLCPNCAKSLYISGRHFVLRAEGGAIVAEDANSRRGTFVNGTRISGKCELAEVGRIGLGCEKGPCEEAKPEQCDGLLLDARTFRAKPERIGEVENGFPARKGELPGMDGVGLFDCVHLRRLSNYPHHEYLILLRQAHLGAHVENPVRIHGEGIRDVHARLLLYRGELLLNNLGEAGELSINGRALDKCDLYPLGSGDELVIGTTRIRVRKFLSSDFKARN